MLFRRITKFIGYKNRLLRRELKVHVMLKGSSKAIHNLSISNFDLVFKAYIEIVEKEFNISHNTLNAPYDVKFLFEEGNQYHMLLYSNKSLNVSLY